MKANLDIVASLEHLWRYARVLTHNDDDADDLVQEALTRALAFSRTYDRSRPALPWLITIVRNTFFSDLIRASAESHRVEQYAALVDPTSLPSQEHSAELVAVQKAMSALPTDQAEVLHIIGVLGFTYAEASDVLAVPIGTVMSRLSRARASLKENLHRRSVGDFPHLKVVGGRDATPR